MKCTDTEWTQIKRAISAHSNRGFNLTPSLRYAGVTAGQFSKLTNDEQRELIQAWLYPPEIEESIPQTTLNTITADVKNLASIEYVNDDAAMNSSVRFVDQNGNEYEFDGVCFSEGLKISITKVK